MVDQDDELLGRSRDNLFLQERAASALDEIEARIDLIRPVDRDIDHPGLVGVDKSDPLLPSERAISFGHAKFHACVDFSPSARTMCLAVEPVPRPTTIPSRTNSTAFNAAAFFRLSRS